MPCRTSISKLPSESSRKCTRHRTSCPGDRTLLYNSDSRTLYEPLDTFSFIDMLQQSLMVQFTALLSHVKLPLIETSDNRTSFTSKISENKIVKSLLGVKLRPLIFYNQLTDQKKTD